MSGAITVHKPIRAPRGTRLHTKGWAQEGALRMLMNNLDPEVAEKPAGSDRLRRDGQGRPQLGLLPGHRRQPEERWRTTRP